MITESSSLDNGIFVLWFFFCDSKHRISVHNCAMANHWEMATPRQILSPGILTQWQICALHTDCQPSNWPSLLSFNKNQLNLHAHRVNSDEDFDGISSSWSSQQWDMSLWWPSLGLLNWYPLTLSRHCNSFEDRVPVDLICGYAIFNWIAVTWQGW